VGVLQSILFPEVRVEPAQLRAAVSGKTVLITGASFGIGESVARQAARAGAHVVLVARTADRLGALADVIRAEGGVADTYRCDLTHQADLERPAERLGNIRPDIFVSNAGKSIRRPIFQSLDRYHDVTRTAGVNFLGPVRLALAAIPHLVERRGHIINISAANVLLPPAPYWAAYQASKTAFDQWLRCAAPELRARGVAVTSLYLPLVRTRMIAPTAIYAKMPAMDPEQAATLVAKTMVTRRRRWAPWWLPPARFASAPLRRPWEALAEWQQRRALG